MHKVTFPGLPDELWRHGHVLCAQFCDWAEPAPGAAWVEIAEEFFRVLGTTPTRGYAFSGRKGKTADFVGPEARGVWNRIRTQATEALATPGTRSSLVVETQYDYKVGETSGDACVLIMSGQYFPLRKSQISIAVAAAIGESPSRLMEKIGSILRQHSRPKWGAAFMFPSAAGAQFYLDGTTFSGPEVRALGPPSMILAEHQERVHRSNHRTSTEFSYGLGYVRELYEINLLSETHLRAPLLGSTVRAYAESVGSLQSSSLWSGLFEWRLGGDELSQARADWEASGLVLSAECQPFRWQ
jgi:hypothetical protein